MRETDRGAQLLIRADGNATIPPARNFRFL
jgi:hypothetical protein